MIRHSVIFRLKYSAGSPEEKTFLEAAAELVHIPGVKKFETLKQTSKKNPFSFGLSMEFDDQETYEAYNDHPEHTAFIQQYWITYVEDFLEIDYEKYNF